MIPFRLTFEPGAPLYEQVVYAAKKALVAGQLRPGDAFPSVRALSRELKINPNTAHKVVAQLVQEGVLEVLPGQGTVVAKRQEPTRANRAALLGGQVEELVVEARKLGLTLEEVRTALESQWRRLGGKP
ncbi:MAG: GntR family transcriptional regulator [Bryobacteraceae bacterium]|nr:GntR family transcriptional regulator [Bryobacteraceae bacterium]